MRRWVLVLCMLALGGCAGDDAPVLETVAATPLEFSLHAEGELKSARATPLIVPGANWSARQLVWALPEGSLVAKGDLIARFAAPAAQVNLAQAKIDLQRNALARSGKQGELLTGEGRVAVDLAQVGTQLGIARRYAGADIQTIARNDLLDAVQDSRYLAEKQDTLRWKQGQFGRRGGAELAVLDAQRATYANTARNLQGELDALELRAPHDGVLMLATNWTGEKPMVGSTLPASFEYGSLPDATSMEVELSLPQLQAQGLRAGVAVQLFPDGRPRQMFATRLSWVASAAKVRSRESPVKYVSMKAPVPLAAIRRFHLVPGQHMQARLILLHAARAMSVPNVAIESEDGRSYVRVRTATGVERRRVQLGVRGPARSEVLGGLHVGDKVLLVDRRPATGATAPDASSAPDGKAGGA